MPRAQNRTRQAFTLVELLVWTLVASLIAGTGYALLAPWAQERKLRAGAERVATALELGRDVARHEGRAVRVRVAPAGVEGTGNSVHVTYVDTGRDVLDPLTKSGLAVDFEHEPALRGIRVVASAAGGDDTLEFDAQGEPVDLGGEFGLQCGDASSVVHVQPYSGRVTIDAAAEVVRLGPIPPEPAQR